MLNQKLSTLNGALTLVSAIALVGPLLIMLAVITGGDPMDGFAAGPTTNSDFHDSLFRLGVLAVPVSSVIGLVVSTLFCVARAKADKLYLLLPVISLIVPIIGMIATFILGAVIASAY